ncbi:TPA: hypothetical protein DCY67_01765 [Candidatus Acetothermia bacterium]|nr:hypothetical protein [Candidatus Acetothermia bacterium]
MSETFCLYTLAWGINQILCDWDSGTPGQTRQIMSRSVYAALTSYSDTSSVPALRIVIMFDNRHSTS